MRLDEDAVRGTSADAWERWARRCAELTPQQWSTATRCTPWDCEGWWLVCAPTDRCSTCSTPRRPTDTAAVADAAEMLRRFNAPGGIAHTSADSIAERATAAATTLTPGEAVTRFTECAEILRATTMSNEDSDLVSGSRQHDIGGNRRGRVDGGHRASARSGRRGGRRPAVDNALAATRDLLVAVPDPIGGDRSPRRAGRSSGRYAGDPVTVVTPLTANWQLPME